MIFILFLFCGLLLIGYFDFEILSKDNGNVGKDFECSFVFRKLNYFFLLMFYFKGDF